MRRGFNEYGKPTFGSIEAFPKRKTEGPRESFPGGYVFDGAELVEASDDVVIGEDAALVDAPGAVGDHAGLVESNHDIHTFMIHL